MNVSLPSSKIEMLRRKAPSMISSFKQTDGCITIHTMSRQTTAASPMHMRYTGSSEHRQAALWLAYARCKLTVQVRRKQARARN